MTSKTFDQPEEALITTTTTVAQGTSFTWQNLAGHWLRPHTDLDHEIRRQAALQRWRGLNPETTARL